MTERELLDDDGENRAVRTFLQLYGGTNSPTVGSMRYHLAMSGFGGCWPDWAAGAHPDEHLTKGGAQSWLRYLFGLEQAASAKPPSQMLTVEQMESLIVEQAARIFELENAASAAPAQEPGELTLGALLERLTGQVIGEREARTLLNGDEIELSPTRLMVIINAARATHPA